MKFLTTAIALQTSLVFGKGRLGTLEFSELEALFGGDDQKVLHAKTVTKNGVKMPLDLFTIGSSGDKIGDVTFGAHLDQTGKQLYDADGKPRISNDPDFTSIMVDEETGKIFSLVHFERDAPANAYLVEIEQDTKTCTLKPKRYEAVLNAKEGGIHTPCSGSVTPWGTHLGSEETNIDTKVYEQLVLDAPDTSAVAGFGGSIREQMQFFEFPVDAEPTIQDYLDNFFPYQYGHNWEFKITNGETGEYNIEKLYALGRFASELCKVAPNNKTAYCSDDSNNIALYRFEAEVAKDLNAGSLYCAKVDQLSDEEGGTFDVSWIKLGETADARTELKPLAKTLKFSDMFDTAEPVDGACPDTFKGIQIGSVKYDDAGVISSLECLRLKENKEKEAAFFETRRYAAYAGCTSEFTRMEGIAFDQDNRKFYLALTAISQGMVVGKDNFSLNDDIHLKENVCGCVYEMDVETNSYVINKLKSIKCGVPTADGDCEVNGLANPDNIVAIDGYGELLIAEDSGKHEHNYLWSMNIDTKELKRIVSVERKAEVTGPVGFHFSNVNNCDYFLFVNQHPYDNLPNVKGAASVNFLSSNSLEAIMDEEEDVVDGGKSDSSASTASTTLGLAFVTLAYIVM